MKVLNKSLSQYITVFKAVILMAVTVLFLNGTSLLAQGTGPSNPSSTLGGLLDSISLNIGIIAPLVSFIAYILGVLFLALGLQKLYRHIAMGPQAEELKEPIKFILTAGLLFALPSIAGVIQTTFGDEGDAPNLGAQWDDTSGVGYTLDAMMVNFVQDFYEPMQFLLSVFCYIAGAVLMLIAVHRFTKDAQAGAQGPLGMGTISTFILAGVLFSVAPTVGMFMETLFGSRDSYLRVEFMALGDSIGGAQPHVENVITSILAFLVIVGIISVIRGFFILRGVGEGEQQMTMMGGVTHIVAGAILINMGEFANIIQNTLGIQAYGLSFSAF